MQALCSIRHHFSVAYFQLKLMLMVQLEYPIFLVSWACMVPLQYFSGVWMLHVLTTQFQPLAGWSFAQIAFVYGLALISHGLQVLFFIQTWGIDRHVTEGLFDRMLVRPLGLLFQFLSQYINLIGCLDLIPGFIIFFYACHELDFVWTPTRALVVLLVVAAATLLRAGLYLMVGSVAFWTYRSRDLIMVVQQIQQRGSLYPIAIYGYPMQWLLTFLLPIGFIAYYPACDLLGQEDGMDWPLSQALLTPLVGGLVFLLGNLCFRLGLRNYESAGS